MEFRTLQYFLTVAREGTITGAAAVLHLTQPTLSRQLAALEEELQVRLFERGTRRITLTEEGRLLYRRAGEITELAEKTAEELLQQGEELEGVIVIGCGEFDAVGVLTEQMAEFRQLYPKVKFVIDTGNADSIGERLDRGLLDLGLFLEPFSREKYEFMRTHVQERWCVLMRADDPLAEKEAVTAADLLAGQVIMVKREAVQAELASWFGEPLRTLSPAYTSNMSTNAAVLVWQKQGRALVIEGSVPFLDQNRLVLRPLSPELFTTSVLAWKRDQPTGRAVGQFLKFMRQKENLT